MKVLASRTHLNALFIGPSGRDLIEYRGKLELVWQSRVRKTACKMGSLAYL